LLVVLAFSLIAINIMFQTHVLVTNIRVLVCTIIFK
jgi:hypothetical protein